MSGRWRKLAISGASIAAGATAATYLFAAEDSVNVITICILNFA